MKILSKENGINIYDELNCDVCGEMSGPRSLYDCCLKCGATREERVIAGRKIYADLIISCMKTDILWKANELSKRLGIKISVDCSYKITA